MAWIAPAIGVAGSLLTGKSGKAAQKAQSQLEGSESTAIDDLMKQYFGPGGAAQTMSTLTPQLLNWLQNPTSDPAFNSILTSLGAQSGSTVRTLQGDSGYGTANPGSLATRLFGQGNAQAGQTAAESIGGLQQSNLGGLQSIIGAQGEGLGQGLGTASNLSNQISRNTPQSNTFGSLGTLASALFTNGGPFAPSSNAPTAQPVASPTSNTAQGNPFGVLATIPGSSGNAPSGGMAGALPYGQ